MFRRVVPANLIAAALVAGGSMSCGAAIQDRGPIVDDAVPVQPRVILDGLIELSENSGGRVFVDEVVFHAPSVVLKDLSLPRGQQVLVDELDVDDNESPLLFRYDVAAPDGAAVGGERRWLLPSSRALSTALSFGFRPLDASESELREMQAEVGYKLDELQTHTAYVHGYVAVAEASTVDGTSVRGGDPDGSPADTGGDPDGSPADNSDQGGDPDGSPAEGDPDGSPAEGDPDGSPADTSGDGDPDGSPADQTGSGDPDGSPADGDDTTPGAMQESTTFSRKATFRRETMKVVPFYVVVNDTFTLQVPVSSLPDVVEGAILPIDLHLKADRLFSAERMATLDRNAKDPNTTVFLELDGDDADSVFTVQRGKVQDAPKKSEDGLHVTSDPRGH